jgi:hypothetical protein
MRVKKPRDANERRLLRLRCEDSATHLFTVLTILRLLNSTGFVLSVGVGFSSLIRFGLMILIDLMIATE